MKITTRSRYGLKAVIDIAVNSDNGPIFLKDVARRQDISLKYLDSIISDLRKAGLVMNKSAKHGGYKLGRSSKDIYVYEIIDVLEGGLAIIDCSNEPSSCRRSLKCVTKKLVWDKVKDALKNCFNISIEELAQKQKEVLLEEEQVYHI